MGDPRRSKNTWNKPAHPWQKTRIDQEKIWRRAYGLGSKSEIWKMTSLLKKMKDQAKILAAGAGDQIDKEKYQLLKRASKLGLIKEAEGLDAILGIPVETVMDRRLQTIVFKKGLARSMKQARQFIVHQHILLGNSKITAPGYIVHTGEETLINFVPHSKLASADHPERAILVRAPKSAAQEQKEAERRNAPRGRDGKPFRRPLKRAPRKN